MNPSIYEPITPLTSPTSPITPSTLLIYELIYEPTNRSSTQSLRPTNLRLHRRPRAFAPRIDLRPKATNPRTDLSLCVILIFYVIFCVILIDSRTHEPLISDFFVVVVVVWVVVFWWLSCFVVVGFVWVVVGNSIFRMLPNT